MSATPPSSATVRNIIPPDYHLVTKHFNPLLSRLTSLQTHFDTLPKEGHHINASFTRDKNIVEECLNRVNSVAINKNPIPNDIEQMAVDEGIIIVYQAFNRGIAKYASENQKFLGCPLYAPNRMTWIKTSCLWCLHRCEWATRDVNQERMLAITLPIPIFDQMLAWTVESHHGGPDYEEKNGSRNHSCSVASTEQEATSAAGKENSVNKKNADSTKKNKNNDDGNDDNCTDDKKEAQAVNEKKFHSMTKTTTTAAQRKVPSRTDPVRLQWDPDHTEHGDKLQRRAIQLGMRGPSLELFHKAIICIDDITDSVVAPGRPSKFDSNKSWMEFYDCSKKSSESVARTDENETNKRLKKRGDNDKKIYKKSENSKNGNDESESDENHNEKEHEETSISTSRQKEGEKTARRRRILLPLEELYVPRDLAIAKHIQLDTVSLRDRY